MPYILHTDDYGYYYVFVEENNMPSQRRFRTCIACDTEIDTIRDIHQVDEGGCCFRCADHALEGFGEIVNDVYGHMESIMNRRRRGVIHPYSYRPRRFNSKGNFPTEVLMGIELEVGGDKHDIAARVAEVDSAEETLYCKEDCSIYGVEIVSHPMTLAWCKEWNGYATLLELLRGDDCYSDNSACQCGDYSCDHSFGLHIHVSRNAFKQLRRRTTAPEPMAENETYEQRIGREMRAIRRQQKAQEAINHQMIWIMFLERNADKLSGDDKLARRESRRWGAFKKSSLEELRHKGESYPYGDEGRYVAINCVNDKTYELRFFKSTVDTEELYAAIEFADASVEFTRNINADAVLRGRALEWSNFVGWINEQKTDTENGVVMKYANLISQINTLGL